MDFLSDDISLSAVLIGCTWVLGVREYRVFPDACSYSRLDVKSDSRMSSTTLGFHCS